MSDILIKNMEMPKTCRKCDLHSYTRTMAGDMRAYCMRLRHQYGFTIDVDLYLDEGRHPECPLVEVNPVESIEDVMEKKCYVEVKHG